MTPTLEPALGLPYLQRPPAPAQDDNAPLLVMLHGFASYEAHLFPHAPLFDPMLRVIAPRAPLRIGPGAYRWFHFSRTPDGPMIVQAEQIASLQALLDFLDKVRRTYTPRQLFLLGHSQGGTMALSAAMARPERIDGLININGRLLRDDVPPESEAAALRDLPVFQRHGADNPIVPQRLALDSRDRLSRFGARVDYGEVPDIGHHFTPGLLDEAARWLQPLIDRPG